jgi:hypothetical protein
MVEAIHFRANFRRAAQAQREPALGVPAADMGEPAHVDGLVELVHPQQDPAEAESITDFVLQLQARYGPAVGLAAHAHAVLQPALALPDAIPVGLNHAAAHQNGLAAAIAPAAAQHAVLPNAVMHAAAQAGGVPRIQSRPLFRFADHVVVNTVDARPALQRISAAHGDIVCPDMSNVVRVDSVDDGDALLDQLVVIGLVQGAMSNRNQNAVLALSFQPTGECIPILILHHAWSAERIQTFAKALGRPANRWKDIAVLLNEAASGLSCRMYLLPDERQVNLAVPFCGLTSMAIYCAKQALRTHPLQAGQTADNLFAALLATTYVIEQHLEMISDCCDADQHENEDAYNATIPDLEQQVEELAQLSLEPNLTGEQLRRRNALSKLEKAREIIRTRSGRVPRSAAELINIVMAELRLRRRPDGIDIQFTNADGSDWIEAALDAEEDEANLAAVDFVQPFVEGNTKELAAWVAAAEADDFPIHLFIDDSYCVIDSTAAQVEEGTFLYTIDISDQSLSNLGPVAADADAGVGEAHALSEPSPVDKANVVPNPVDLSARGRPKQSFAVDIAPFDPVFKLANIEVSNGLPCTLVASCKMAAGGRVPMNENIRSRDAFVQLCRKWILEAEKRCHSQHSIGPLSTYLETRLMSTPNLQADVQGKTFGRVPLSLFLRELRAVMGAEFDSVTLSVESYNAKSMFNQFATKGASVSVVFKFACYNLNLE